MSSHNFSRQLGGGLFFFSQIKIFIRAECVFSSSQVAPNVESFVVILLYFVQIQKVYCVWMTHGRVVCRLRIRFMSILLGFNFCLHFTLPGIFSPQSLKSYLRLWHNQTIIPHLTSPESQTNKRPNTKCKIVLQSECQYHDHYYQAQCKYKQEADFWLVRSGQHCPLIGHFTRFTKGGVRGNSQSNIWSEKSVRFVLGNLTRLLTYDVSIVKCSRLVHI